MPVPMRLFPMLLFLLCMGLPVRAQLPFYTDDPAVTDRGKWHFEFFDEFDALQSPQYPNLRQNTASYKLNYGLPYNLELDVDAPYLSIFRAVGAQTAAGAGDTPEELFDEVERLPDGSLSVLADGRRLKLSNWDKVLFPATGFTKGDLIAYYARIAPVLVPHLSDRPLTLKRYPEGVEQPLPYVRVVPDPVAS